jgi:hypothetical protein
MARPLASGKSECRGSFACGLLMVDGYLIA